MVIEQAYKAILVGCVRPAPPPLSPSSSPSPVPLLLALAYTHVTQKRMLPTISQSVSDVYWSAFWFCELNLIFSFVYVVPAGGRTARGGQGEEGKKKGT